jgi:HK97 family phage portal protein
MMFDGVRSAIRNGVAVLGAALTTIPRWVQVSRVPVGRTTASGVRITPDNAVTIPAVWACLRYISQTVAVLPWHVMRDGKKGAEISFSHPVDFLLAKRISAEWSSFQFRETLTHWALRWGNGYAEIEPDKAGRPFALWPIHPERVEVYRAIETSYDAYGETIKVGELYYQVSQGSNASSPAAAIILSTKRMFHIRGFGEGPVGVNVMAYAAESLGWAKAAQLFGASFFGNGANVSTVVINKKPLKPDGLRRQRAEFEQLYKGVRNSSRTAFLDADSEIKTIGLDAEKSQLVETNQALVSDICRWFGVPPHKVMDLTRSTFSNIESQTIEVVVDSISPWVKRFEDEADYKLFSSENRRSFYSRMNMRGLMRGDFKARVEYYGGMVKIGAYSPNRVLELEDENTIGPAGDIHVMQNQNVTLEQIARGADEPVPATAPADPGQATPPEDPEDAPAAEMIERIGRLIGEAENV